MSDLLTLSPAEFCRITKACEEGSQFALRHATMADVWDNCPRPDWLAWVKDTLGQRLDEQTLRLFAVWCARNAPLAKGGTTGDLLMDSRSLAALDVAERYAHGHATAQELAAARDAAEAAAWTATRTATCDAAEAAARDATWAAAWGTAARWAALVAARKAQADQLRRMVPNPFRAKEGQP